MKELTDQDPLKRDAAAQAMGRAKYRPAVPALLTMIRRDKLAYVRIAAIDALGQIGDPEALEPLVSLVLKANDVYVRSRAAFALGGIKDPRTVGPLMAAMYDRAETVRSSAAWSLGSMQDPRALQPLATALTDRDALVRSNAAWALARFEDAKAANLFVSAMRRGLLNPPDPTVALSKSAIDAVHAAASDAHADLRVRQAGLTVLRRSGDPRVLECAIAMLKDPSDEVRLAAADAMIFAQDSVAVIPLVAALGDSSEKVRGTAKRALLRTMYSVGNAGSPEAVPVLMSALENTDPDVRKGAAGALGEIGDARAAAVLSRAAETNDLVVVAAAYAYFIREGNPGREQLLIRALAALGDAEMAKDFLNCGNVRLAEVGRRWRIENGLDTDPLRPTLVTVQWGKKRR